MHCLGEGSSIWQSGILAGQEKFCPDSELGGKRASYDESLSIFALELLAVLDQDLNWASSFFASVASLELGFNFNIFSSCCRASVVSPPFAYAMPR